MDVFRNYYTCMFQMMSYIFCGYVLIFLMFYIQWHVHSTKILICRRVSGAVGLASFRRSGYDQQAPRQLRNAEAKADHPALAVARGDELVQHLVGPAHHHLVASILSKEGEHGTVFKNNGRTLNIWQSLKHNFKNYAASTYSLSSSCIA